MSSVDCSLGTVKLLGLDDLGLVCPSPAPDEVPAPTPTPDPAPPPDAPAPAPAPARGESSCIGDTLPFSTCRAEVGMMLDACDARLILRAFSRPSRLRVASMCDMSSSVAMQWLSLCMLSSSSRSSAWMRTWKAAKQLVR